MTIVLDCINILASESIMYLSKYKKVALVIWLIENAD